MKYIQKGGWAIWGMILLSLLLNVFIISASNKNQGLLWVLIVSIPLLSIAIYFAWQTGHLRQGYFNDDQRPSVQLGHSTWLSHSVYPTKLSLTDLKVKIGNDQCNQPYTACILNVGSMEDSDLGNTFIQATKKKELSYSEYPVDEGLNIYHLAAGGLVWQIEPGYLGCRAENGHFNSNAFKETARKPEVKMIELKLPSAIKSSYPVESFLGFSEPIDRNIDNCIFSGSGYTNFSDAEGMIHFLDSLRELSDGKPIGIRLCINDKKEFFQICHAVRKTQLIPDFIVVEGSFGDLSTDIVHEQQACHTGIPLYEALLFVSQTLQMYGLQDKIKVIADGKIISCFDILKVLAMGADVVCTEMPRYTTVRHPGDGRKLSLHYKSWNVYDFHNSLMKDTVKIMKICGFKSVSEITLSKFFTSLDVLHAKSSEVLNGPGLYPGSVRKIYNSTMNFHRSRDEMKKVSVS